MHTLALYCPFQYNLYTFKLNRNFSFLKKGKAATVALHTSLTTKAGHFNVYCFLHYFSEQKTLLSLKFRKLDFFRTSAHRNYQEIRI